MIHIKSIFAILLVTFCINNTVAQFGNDGYGNQGGFGNNRMSQMNQNIPQDNKPEEESEKSKLERLNKIIEKLKTDLKLDELQVYAVKNVLEDSMKKQAAIVKNEKSQDEKIEEFQALSESTDRKISEFLNKTQKLKYVEMNAERKEKIQEMIDRRR